MAGQDIRYAVHADSNLRQFFTESEAQALKLESAIAGVNSTLKEIALGAGVGYGLHMLVDLGKQFIDTATQLESYHNLIKFASASMADAAAAQRTINDAVHDFKLPIMETTQEYSQLMAMVKGTPVEGAKANAMFRDLAETLSIMHLPAEKVQSSIGNIGKLLEEGNLQARYLRNLIRDLPGIGTILAHDMGTDMEGLNQLINKGKTTTLDAYKYLPTALAELKDEYGTNLPEALQSFIANTNELKNTWIEFQREITDKMKPEIIDFFHSLEDGIEWLKAHEDDIISWGQNIAEVAELMVKWKIASGAWAIIQSSAIGLMGEQAHIIKNIVAVTDAETIATQKNIVAATEQEVELQKIKSVLAENTAQMDLFTQAQISNIATTEKLKDVWVQLDMFGSGVGSGDAAFLGFGTRSKGGTHGLHDRYRITTEDIASRYANNPNFQGDLFANAAGGYLFDPELEAAAHNSFGLSINKSFQTERNRLGSALGAGTSLIAGALPVAVTFMAIDVIEKISGYIGRKDRYTNATDAERLELDKESALKQVKDVNSFSGGILNALMFGHGNSAKLDAAGKDNFLSSALGLNYGIGDLVRAHPEVLKDQKYVDEVRRILDIKGDLDLIDLAHQLGFYSSSERENSSNFMNTMLGRGGGARGIIWPTPDGRAPSNDHYKKMSPPQDKITGQRVITYNIRIGEMNGQKIGTQTNGGSGSDVKNTAEQIARLLENVVNDTELHTED